MSAPHRTQPIATAKIAPGSVEPSKGMKDEPYARLIVLPRPDAVTAGGPLTAGLNVLIPDVEFASSVIANILYLAGVAVCAHESIINEMITGECERPSTGSDDDTADHPLSHSLIPILNAGIDFVTSEQITQKIADSQVGSALQDARRLREQQAALALLDQAA